MKTNRLDMRGHPFLAWTDLAWTNVAWTIGEMWVASAQVISHRTVRMATAGSTPSTRDVQEFTRMGQEKIDAAIESLRAMASHLATMNQKFAADAIRHMVTGNVALIALASTRNFGESVRRHATLAETLSRSAAMAADYSGSVARLASRGLTPIHARATANARRLRKH